jgi:hypothetical protein
MGEMAVDGHGLFGTVGRLRSMGNQERWRFTGSEFLAGDQ